MAKSRDEKEVKLIEAAMGVLGGFIRLLVKLYSEAGLPSGALYKLATPEGEATLVLATKAFIAEVARTVTPVEPKPVLATPEDNVEFGLTISGDAVDPMEMVRSDGYDPREWKFHGPEVKGPQAKTFELLNLGYCRDRKDAERKASDLGFTLAEGQWREAFRQKFSKPTRPITVIVGGSEWVNPHGHRRVPCLRGGGRSWDSRFHWSGRDFRGSYRWLGSRK